MSMLVLNPIAPPVISSRVEIPSAPSQKSVNLTSSVASNNLKNPSLLKDSIITVFKKTFHEELEKSKSKIRLAKDKTAKDEATAKAVETCQVLEVKCNKTAFDQYFAFTIKIDKETKANNRPHFKAAENEIGFFNFKISNFVNENNEISVSYFSEVNLEERFQGRGVFSVILKAYDAALRTAGADLDYLHVVSAEPGTAAIYQYKGYNFTPESEKVIEEEFGGLEAYLADSSVSYGTASCVEMTRNLSNAKLQIEGVKPFLEGCQKVEL